tara:strand:+ start:649 stop:4338 length:3690 start_codon:yes stop_codon:yes gene_type:complete
MAKKQKARKVVRHRRRKYHEGSHSINKVGRYVPHSPAHSNMPESTLKAMYEMAKGNGSFDGTFAEFQVSFSAGQPTSESNNTSEATQETPTVDFSTIYDNAVSQGYKGTEDEFRAMVGGGLSQLGLGFGNIFGQNVGAGSGIKPITGDRSDYTPNLSGFDPSDYATLTQEERIQQLIDRQGMTKDEAIANQQASLDKGFDINQDGVVSGEEFADLRDAGMTIRAGQAGFDPAKFTSDKRGSIGYDPAKGFATKSSDVKAPVIEKTEPIKYETIESQPIPQEAILDESKVFIEIKEDKDKDEEGREGARKGGIRYAAQTGGRMMSPQALADMKKLQVEQSKKEAQRPPPPGRQQGALLPTTAGPRPMKPPPPPPEPVSMAQPDVLETPVAPPPPDVDPTFTESGVAQAGLTDVDAPNTVEVDTYDATLIDEADVPTIEAQQGTLSEGAIAQFQPQTLTERAVAAGRDAAQEQAALAVAAQYRISDGAYVDKVTGKTTEVAPTKEAEVAQRRAIIGKAAEDAEAAQILETLNYEAAQVRAVKGTAAKGAAADMVAEVGELPPEISATIVEDPQTVEAQIDDEPIEIQAAVAALPTEALVSSQMETLLGGIEDGEVPVWARPAVEQVNRMLEQRGLTASTVGRDALLNSIIQSAMPIAQSNAQALQQRSAQNLSNEQQANVQQANLDAQRRLQNTANRQTAASQTAQMAQQMSVLQSQFAQDAMITSAAQAQQTRMANLQNRQQSAIQNVQNQQAINAQNLGNEQQTELANLQFEFQTNAANMSAENQSRLVEMQTAADFLAKNAGFKQQMELANLSNEQQMELANLTALNQASSENLTAEQQTRLANLDSRMKTNMLQAQIASQMNLAQLSVDQQRAVQNAAMVARVDMAQFNAEQQVAMANSKFMQSMTMQDLNNRQQATMQNAAAMASLDLTNANNQTRLASQNAQAFLQMDMTNLNNRQQAAVLDAQMMQQTLLSNQSMENAAKQFNAQSTNQINQFNESLAAQIEMANAQQANAMAQFNAGQANNMTQLDKQLTTQVDLANLQARTQTGIAQLQSETQITTTGMQTAAQIKSTQIGADAQVQSAGISAGAAVEAAGIRAQSAASIANAQIAANREQFNAQNAFIASQSALDYERRVNMMDTAAENEMNKLNAQQEFQISAMGYESELLAARDESAYLRQSFENDKALNTQLYIAAIGNETAASKESNTNINNLLQLAQGIFQGGGGG